MVNWAKENAAVSGLSDKPIRWLVDDCTKFVEREIRRGNHYDAIIMDPPSYGRGPKGEIWKIEESIHPFIRLCTQLLSDDPLFFPLQEYLLPDGTFSPELWAMLSEEDQLKLTDAIASGLLNWTDEARKLIQLLTPCWKAAYEDGATVAGDAYGFVEIQRPEFVSAAKVNGGKRVVGIEQTTRDNIARIISRGISEGKSQIELKKEIQSEMGSTESRAKLIARQETSTALSTGQFDMMKAAGAATKTWHHRPQKNPRPDHVDMDGETVGIDQRFSNGLRFPRDPEDGRAEQLINCRCYLTYGGF